MVKFEDLEVGQAVGSLEFLFTRDSLVRYAGASGDFNTIHYRDDIATEVGLPGVLAHGMLTMGAAVQVAVNWVGDAGRVIDYQVKFTKPVVVHPQEGAVVTVSATIGAIDEETQTVRIDLEALFEENKVLGKAQAVVRF